MLNRRILRIKAFKAIYSYAENQSLSLKEIIAQTDKSCESTRDLYLFLLGLVPAVTAEASARTEAARAKFHPTEEEKNPNMKFITNKVSPLLSEDPDFCKLFSKKKLSWEQYDVFIRHLYESIRDSEYFNNYMTSGESSLKEDAGLWADIFANELEDNSELEEILEDLNIWWNDDLVYAVNWCCAAMDNFAKGKRWNLPELYTEGNGFIRDIVTKGVISFDRYYDEVARRTEKWDKSRICPTDLALIVTGAAEHDSCADIPAKVTINEYVEIAKFYSPESRAFINGLLDKLINS